MCTPTLPQGNPTFSLENNEAYPAASVTVRLYFCTGSGLVSYNVKCPPVTWRALGGPSILTSYRNINRVLLYLGAILHSQIMKHINEACSRGSNWYLVNTGSGNVRRWTGDNQSPWTKHDLVHWSICHQAECINISTWRIAPCKLQTDKHGAWTSQKIVRQLGLPNLTENWAALKLGQIIITHNHYIHFCVLKIKSKINILYISLEQRFINIGTFLNANCMREPVKW